MRSAAKRSQSTSETSRSEELASVCNERGLCPLVGCSHLLLGMRATALLERSGVESAWNELWRATREQFRPTGCGMEQQLTRTHSPPRAPNENCSRSLADSMPWLISRTSVCIRAKVPDNAADRSSRILIIRCMQHLRCPSVANMLAARGEPSQERTHYIGRLDGDATRSGAVPNSENPTMLRIDRSSTR